MHSVVDGHDTASTLTSGLVAALVGSGTPEAVHDPADQVSSRPCMLPDESWYVPPAIHSSADGQDKPLTSTSGSKGALAGSCTPAAVQDPPTRSARQGARGHRIDPITWDEIDTVDPRQFTIATVPARYAELGDLHQGIDDSPFRLDTLLEWAERDNLD
jgi:hypothetical protein